MSRIFKGLLVIKYSGNSIFITKQLGPQPVRPPPSPSQYWLRLHTSWGQRSNIGRQQRFDNVAKAGLEEDKDVYSGDVAVVFGL